MAGSGQVQGGPTSRTGRRGARGRRLGCGAVVISWVIVGVAFVALLALDILIARRGHGALRSAIWWSLGWFAIGLAFTGAVIALEGGRGVLRSGRAVPAG